MSFFINSATLFLTFCFSLCLSQLLLIFLTVPQHHSLWCWLNCAPFVCDLLVLLAPFVSHHFEGCCWLLANVPYPFSADFPAPPGACPRSWWSPPCWWSCPDAILLEAVQCQFEFCPLHGFERATVVVGGKRFDVDGKRRKYFFVSFFLFGFVQQGGI